MVFLSGVCRGGGGGVREVEGVGFSFQWIGGGIFCEVEGVHYAKWRGYIM